MDPCTGAQLDAVEQMHGYARTISDGTLYPAIARLVADGLITRHAEPGKAGAQRQTLRLTGTGAGA